MDDRDWLRGDASTRDPAELDQLAALATLVKGSQSAEPEGSEAAVNPGHDA
jgi:hypothetical protein